MAQEVPARINTELRQLPLDRLKLLEVNARYMTHTTFHRLVENIRRDGGLTSVPFAVLEPDGTYTVLSGNHRVAAAREAGLTDIQVMVTEDTLDPKRRVAIQLSHNAIAGEDDPATLKALYEQINDVDLQMYSGLDDDTLKMLAEVSVDALGPVSLPSEIISILFLPEEAAEIQVRLEELASAVNGEVWLGRHQAYERLLELLGKVMRAHDIRNNAVALDVLVGLALRHQDDLSEGWDIDDDLLRKRRTWVPMASVFGTDDMPAKAAKIVARAIEAMVSRKEVSPGAKWQAIELLAADYLAGE